MEWCDYVISLLKKEQEELISYMKDGSCSSYDQYKNVAGEINGLEKACMLIEEAKDRHENDEDFED